MNILAGDFSNPQILNLLGLHLAAMHAASPPGHVHALDLSGLKTPSVSFWAAWEGDDLLGFGALKQISPYQAEIKSMRTTAKHLRQGIAAKLLQHIISTAKIRGYNRLSLETGSGPAFEPALALYRRYGFAQGGAFGAYRDTEFSQFFHIDL